MSQLSTDLRGDQLAPHSIEAEQAVIGSILIDPECMGDVLGIIRPGDFFIVRLAWIYEALVAMRDGGMPIDYLTAVQHLEQSGRLGDIGGAAYILSLINQTPSALNVEGYALIVARMAHRRRLIDFAQNTARLAHSDETDLNAIYERVSAELAALSGPLVKTFTPARVLFSEFIDGLSVKVNAAGNGHAHVGIKTGLPDLDMVFGGDFGPGSYNVIFGPTKIGKTWLVLQITLSAMRQLPVVFFTLENTEDSLRERLVAVEAEVPYTFIRTGQINGKPMDAETHRRCLDAAAVLSEMPFEVVDYATSAAQIAQHLNGATIRYGRPGLCFVDTLNQLADSAGRDKRYENLTKASAMLLQTMRLTGWGIVATAQQRLGLKAGMKNGSAKEAAWPTKFSLEGARTIVEHCRNLIGMYSSDYVAKETRNDYYEDTDCPRGHVLFVNVGSNETDGTGQARLEWQSGIPKYGPLTRRQDRRVDMEDPSFVMGRDGQ